MNVPPYFYRGRHPRAETVGELIRLLNSLPKDMPVRAGFSERCEVVVYNYGSMDAHVKIDEPQEDDNDTA